MLKETSADHPLIRDTPFSALQPSKLTQSRLIQFFNHPSLDPAPVNPWRHVNTSNRSTYARELLNHAAPLDPLRDQDLEIMSDWFDRRNMTKVEHDIEYHLALLYPEPPWEEHLDLNFLQEHL